VVSVALHLDEATPHLHIVWLPIDDTQRRRGPAVRLNAGRWLDGAAKLRGLLDRYAAAVAWLGLERGVRGARAHHRTVARLYGALQADADAAALSRRQARTLLDQAEALYRQVTALLPGLSQAALAAPMRSLNLLLRGPVAERNGRNQVARER
jgi:hypothetical protein